MKIATLGTRPLFGADLIAFSSNQNINQYDVFIVQLSELSSFIGQFSHVRGATFVPAGTQQHNATSLLNALNRLSRQFDEISEVLDHGASLVVVLDDHKIRYSLSPNGDAAIALTWFLEGLSLTSLVGKDFRTVDSVGENEYFSNFPFDYKYAIQPGNIIRIFESSTRIPGKSQTIGGFCKKGPGEGKVIYLPSSELFAVLSNSNARKPGDLLSNFLTELLQAINRLELSNVRSFEQPEWVLRYLLPKERGYSEEVQQLRIDVSKMTAALQTKELELSAGSWIFDLLTTDGARLEESVTKAIREMGLAVVSGPDKLADALVTDGRLILAVEIKGYKGAAKEGAVSQCNRWVADVSAAIDPEADVADPIVSKYGEKLAELDTNLSNPERMKDFEVKGVVICNTFFEHDLSARPDQVTRVHEHFPEAFLSRANGFKISCLTTLQLTDLLKLSRENKAEAIKKFSEFARTPGIVATNQDWRATFQLEK